MARTVVDRAPTEATTGRHSAYSGARDERSLARKWFLPWHQGVF